MKIKIILLFYALTFAVIAATERETVIDKQLAELM
jgi:hypothetical protein